MTTVRTLPITVSGPDVGLLPTAPTIDPIESDGSLFLFDATHPVNPLPSGTPTDGTTVPNILWNAAADLIGSGSQSTLAGVFQNNFPSTAKGIVERSSKGGLHYCPSPTLIDAVNQCAGLSVPAAVKTYMKAHVGHTFYWSIWSRITRTDTYSAGHHPIALISTDAAFGVVLCARSTIDVSPPPAGRIAYTNTLGVEHQAVADEPAAGFAAGGDTGPSPLNDGVVVGSRSSVNNGHGARVLYRVYLEDLTASGRSWSDVSAIDAAMFAAATGTGGRYAADTTPTNAATFT